MKTRPNPRWGTVEWIRAYPWSLMDRKRRKRVKAILPAGLVALLNADAGLVPYLHALAKHVSNRTWRESLETVVARADAAARKIVDEVVAAALADAWGVER